MDSDEVSFLQSPGGRDTHSLESSLERGQEGKGKLRQEAGPGRNERRTFSAEPENRSEVVGGRWVRLLPSAGADLCGGKVRAHRCSEGGI